MGTPMTQRDVVMILLGLFLATLGSIVFAVCRFLVVPSFLDTFSSFGVDLPFLTIALVDYWFLSFLMPVLVLLGTFAFPRKERRGFWAVTAGTLFLLLSPLMIVAALYLPLWTLGAVVQ
jgi:type II secretory pathway component PulF